MRFGEVWASFQAIGCVALAVGLGVALLALLVVSPTAGVVVLVAIGAFVAYRLASAQRADADRGTPGLVALVARFQATAGRPPRAAVVPGGWTPEAIFRQAALMSEAEADRLGRVYRRLTEENDARDVLEQHPSWGLIIVRAFDDQTQEKIWAMVSKVGHHAGRPIWDRFVWAPQERLLRDGLPADSVRIGEMLEPRFSDAQSAADDAAKAALLAGWADDADIAWLSEPWRSVFGSAS